MATAAYAAVVSLMHVLDQIQHPAWLRLHLDRNKIEILCENISFLQDFLEVHSQRFYEDLEGLATQIALISNEAEDIIDAHVVDQLCDGSVDRSEKGLSFFCEDIDRVIEKIDSIKKALMVKEARTIQERQPKVSIHAARSSEPPLIGKKTMVEFGEQLDRIVEELIGDKSDLQIIPIVGMGGIGKTTLARNAFDDGYMVRHFDIRIWVAISQEYSMREVLLGLLHGDEVDWKNKGSSENIGELGERLYKKLYDRRYLIVMDDVWSTEVWDDLRSFFPNNRNESRIIVTTRMSNMADYLGSRNPYLMDFLDDDKSWDLFCKKAFTGESCPPELEEIGKNIAKSCRGLPLEIVVIGGLLSNSNMTIEYWESVAANVNSFANSGYDEHCLNILSLSYNHLPIHLKPCLLYMSVFPEDAVIKVSKLIKLWVAQGFLKPIRGKTLEDVAKEYLKDLVDRNLILIRELAYNKKIKTCGIHDLLRDLCLRELEKDRFYCAAKVQEVDWAYYKNYKCCLCRSDRVNVLTRINLPQLLVSQPTSFASCLVCDVCRNMYPQLSRLRLVRLIVHESFEEFLQPTKLRHFSLDLVGKMQVVCSSIPLLWNLQNFIVQTHDDKTIVLPSEIWGMPQLRCLVVDNAVLPDPRGTQNTIILENLHTLGTILNFRLSEDVLERIPKMRKLRIHYNENSSHEGMEWSYYSLHNLARLHKLESLYIRCEYLIKMKVAFPDSLKKLVLRECRIPWEDMTMIGSLPNLEVLELISRAFEGPEWNPVDGEFLGLKTLLISDTNLVSWGAESFHFPSLESLTLECLDLEEIPSGIGEIETLRSIFLVCCTESVVDSATKILEKQQSEGYEELQLDVTDYDSYY